MHHSKFQPSTPSSLPQGVLAELTQLEQALLPALDAAGSERWLPLIGRLVSQGHTASVVALLADALDQWPLQQQRRQLLELLDQHPEWSLDPRFTSLWARLRRCAAAP